MQDLGIVPVCCSDEAALDQSVAVDYEGLRPAGDLELSGRGLLRVPDGEEIYVAIEDELAVIAFLFVDVHAEDRVFRMRVMELLHRGQLDDAWRAMTPPEVDQDNLPAISAEMDRIGFV